MNRKDFAKLLRLKHTEADRILISDKSDAYMRAYAYGLADACNDLMLQIGFEPYVTSFEQELIDRRKAEIVEILRKNSLQKVV